MLVLRRKPGEALVINGNIKVIISAVRGNLVKVAIEAPEDVVVVREEILNKEGNDGPASSVSNQ